MILPKEQIYRYMRHIIMPEISGPGQKKLLDSAVAVFAKSPRQAAALMYYIVSSGIGHIYFYFECDDDIPALRENLKDLNPDVVVNYIKIPPEIKNSKLEIDHRENVSCRIILGGVEFIQSVLSWINSTAYCPKKSRGNVDKVTENFADSNIPVILASPGEWNGFIHTVKEPQKKDALINPWLHKFSLILRCKGIGPNDEIFSSFLLGALGAIEIVKLCLDIGNVSVHPLYFDLLTMDFKKGYSSNDNNTSNNIADNKYKLANIKTLLRDARVLIVGTGGLGSPAAYALAQAGVGTIGLVDSDSVEISNLNRQILHSTSRIGTPKVKSAEMFLKKLNPDVNIITYETLFTKSNAMEIIKDFDVVIDGVDNLPTRYLLNDACFFSGKPLAEAGVLRFDGLGMTIVPNEGHCYRCIFPKMPPADSIPSCSESGILGPVPGVMGFIEAAEAVKIITGVGETLKNRLIIFDALDMDFRVTDVRQDNNCPLCGQNPSIKDLTEYEITCKGDAL